MPSPTLPRWTTNNPMLPAVGRYEAHLTTAIHRPEDLLVFRLACSVANVGCLVIELPHGDVPNQPMATCRFDGTLLGALESIERATQILEESGFPVTRTKIETSLEQEFPHIFYHEFHVELSIPAEPDTNFLAQLEAILTPHRARLSQNALNTYTSERDGTSRARRFVTLRIYRANNAQANLACNLLIHDLQRAHLLDIAVTKVHREQVLFDSAEEMDRGWI